MSHASAQVIVFPGPQGGPHRSRVGNRPRKGELSGVVRDWLMTQEAVIAHWREHLVAEGADWRMVAILDQHAAFLREACEL
jgi:hypothetical protein